MQSLWPGGLAWRPSVWGRESLTDQLEATQEASLIWNCRSPSPAAAAVRHSPLDPTPIQWAICVSFFHQGSEGFFSSSTRVRLSSFVDMIFRTSWLLRILLFTSLLLVIFAEIVPRAGVGGAGGKPNGKPRPAPGIHGGSDGTNGILTNLKRFPRPRIEGDEIDDDASVFSLGSFAEDEQVLFESMLILYHLAARHSPETRL